MEVRITLTSKEYQEAVIDYIVRNKLLPEGVDTVPVKKFTLGGQDILPIIEYEKMILPLYNKTKL